MRLIDGNKLKKAVEYSRDVKIGYLNHCAEAGHNPDDKDLIEANIKWHEDMLKLIDDASTIEVQPDHLADASKKGDLISRADAIDAVNNIMPTKEGFYEPCEVLEELMRLPTAQPEESMNCAFCKLSRCESDKECHWKVRWNDADANT